MAFVAIMGKFFWVAAAAMHFLGSTWDSVEKFCDSTKSNIAVCADYFKKPNFDSGSKSNGEASSKKSPEGSVDRNSSKKVGCLGVSKAVCGIIGDTIDVSGKVLLDVYLTGLTFVQNEDGTMWYWPWCVFHDKCHIKPKEVNLKALAGAFKQLEEANVIVNGKFNPEGFKAKWPPKVEIIH